MGFRTKKSKHDSRRLRDKRAGAGRGLCVVSFVPGPRALEGSGFSLRYGFVLGEEKPGGIPGGFTMHQNMVSAMLHWYTQAVV